MAAVFLRSSLHSGPTLLFQNAPTSSLLITVATCRPLLLPPPPFWHAMRFIVVLLAHAPQNGLLLARFLPVLPGVGARLLLGAVRDAPAALHADLLAAGYHAALPRWAVGGAESCTLDVLGAPRVGAGLALGAVGDAQTPLDDAVGAGGEGAHAASHFGFEVRVLLGGGGGMTDCMGGDGERR